MTIAHGRQLRGTSGISQLGEYTKPRASRIRVAANCLRGGTRTARARVRLALKDLRARSRRLFGRLLVRLMGRRISSLTLVPSDVVSVLVCRINGRMGNAGVSHSPS